MYTPNKMISLLGVGLERQNKKRARAGGGTNSDPLIYLNLGEAQEPNADANT